MTLNYHHGSLEETPFTDAGEFIEGLISAGEKLSAGVELHRAARATHTAAARRYLAEAYTAAEADGDPYPALLTAYGYAAHVYEHAIAAAWGYDTTHFAEETSAEENIDLAAEYFRRLG